MSHDLSQSVISTAAKGVVRSNVIYYIYIVFNAPLALLLLIGAIRNMIVALSSPSASILHTAMIALLNTVNVLFYVTAVVSCVGVFLRKGWARILVMVVCSYGLFILLFAMVSSALFGAFTLSLLMLPWAAGSILWLVVFSRAKLYFMSEEKLHDYLRKYGEKYGKAFSHLCRNCINWEGCRKEGDKYDAMCSATKEYHKSDYSCDLYFPFIARGKVV